MCFGPFGAREPQWLGLSLPKNKRRGEGRRRTCSTETYLCGSAPVQNFLLAPRNFAGVSSQGGATGGTGEGTVTKGPGRKTPGDGSIGRRGAQAPPLAEASGIVLMILTWPGMRLSATSHAGAACSRLEKMVRDHDR